VAPETITDEWREKSDDQLRYAADHLAEYTEGAEQVIRAELRRRGFPEPPAIVPTEFDAEASFFSFAGRMGRLEFFWSWLVINVFAWGSLVIIPPLAAGLVGLVLLVLPTVRRLHDLGTSGALCVLLFVPGVNVCTAIIRIPGALTH